MKNYLFAFAVLLPAFLATALSTVAHATTPNIAAQTEEEAHEERIRYNLRQGAFHLNNGIYTNAGTGAARAGGGAANPQFAAPTNSSPLKGLSNTQVRDRLQEWGVNYLFMLDKSDLAKPDGTPFYSVQDFMGNAEAESRGGKKFHAENCKDSRGRQGGQTSAVAAHFDRLSPVDATGGYLLVKEADPAITNLSAYEGFSVGAWVKLNVDSKGASANGGFPIFSKTPLNQVNAQGRSEWEFRVTGNVVYLDISRQGHTQVLSFTVPWWGDRWGSCYAGGIYQDCWHYIGVSFDPAVHKVSVLFLRKFANNIPEAAAESFARIETSAGENALPIEASRQTPLRLGASNSNSMDGILKGVFFARKALSGAELKALAMFTAPTKEGMFCARP